MVNKILIWLGSRGLSVFSAISSWIVKVNNPKDIPIIINNRNRYVFLKKLIDSLETRGYKNIIIIDNNSSYEPLIEYYKTLPYQIIWSKENLGYMALSKLDLYKKVRKSFFVYTDSDVVPIEECPEDFMAYFLAVLKRNFWVSKVGFSLKIDDLPDFYDKKDNVIDWEKQFYNKTIGKNYIAPIDTTFALHKPYAFISAKGIFKMIRTSFPYEARHMPWYNDSNNLTDEEKFYIESVEIGTHWSKGLDLGHVNFITRNFKKLLKK